MAHKEIDLKNPKTNRMNAGFTDQERGKFSDLLAAGFTDTFRYFYPDTEGVYFHNGSKSRDSLPLRCYLFCSTLATGSLRGIVSPSFFHNGSISRDSLPLRCYLFCSTLATGSLRGICLHPSSTTAANPAILCRCGGDCGCVLCGR